MDAVSCRGRGRLSNCRRGGGVESLCVGAGVKRLGELVPMLIAVGLIIALITGVALIAIDLLTQIDRW